MIYLLIWLMAVMDVYQNTAAMPPGLCAMQQHPYYADALHDIGATVRGLDLRDHGQRISHAQLVERRIGPLRLAWLPRGPVWAPGVSVGQKREVFDGLMSHLPRRCILLGMAEDLEDQPLFAYAGFRPLLRPQRVAELKLATTRETRLSKQSVKWRNRLRHALKGPLQTSHRAFDPARDTWLLDYDRITQRQKHYRALPAAFALAWAHRHPHATRLFFAHLQGRIVAAMLILRHPPTASYHIGWTGPDGRAHSAHNLLLWQAANWLADQGCLRLDLGAVDTVNAPGLARFKLGVGAKMRQLGPTMLCLPGLANRSRAA